MNVSRLLAKKELRGGGGCGAHYGLQNPDPDEFRPLLWGIDSKECEAQTKESMEKLIKQQQQQQRNHLVSVGLPVGFAGHLWLRVGGDLCQAGFEHLK
jgi:hypothetical protein